MLSDGSTQGQSVLSQVTPDLRAAIADLLIPADRLSLGDVVGKGYFGHVYRASLKTPHALVPVAVKTLKSGFV